MTWHNSTKTVTHGTVDILPFQREFKLVTAYWFKGILNFSFWQRWLLLQIRTTDWSFLPTDLTHCMFQTCSIEPTWLPGHDQKHVPAMSMRPQIGLLRCGEDVPDVTRGPLRGPYRCHYLQIFVSIGVSGTEFKGPTVDLGLQLLRTVNKHF